MIKTLIRLHMPVPLLFACNRISFSHTDGHFVNLHVQYYRCDVLMLYKKSLHECSCFIEYIERIKEK